MSLLKHITTVYANGRIPVHKYRSESTGLHVVIGEVDGPLVNGFFSLATEADNDDGLPHTLEHLIFLGSEQYPYKGVLDLLANRCLASGTNAWTDTDHTCYTIKTVGKDGFLELLPIYLDHILFPTLSDAGYITEVHHIAPNGEDSGVVYCEMQGRENSGESRASLTLLRLLYPNCGYSAETGGIMHNLRTSTSNEKVQNYHAQFYRPENLTLIITGQVKIDDVSKALESVENKILNKPKKAEFVRPWFSPIEPLADTIDKRIVYPSDCEDCGMVYVGWRGPTCTRENETLTACSVLMRYLSETSVSPLQREMVEISDPYASTVSYNIIENYESTLYFSFENAPLEKIDLVYNKMQTTIEKIGSGEEKFDMTRMQNILERSILEYYSNLESNPHEAIAFASIADSLYGEKSEDFEMRLNVDQQMKSLLTKDEHFWRDLVNVYLVKSKRIIVRAVPSVEEQKRMMKEEAERIEMQRKSLGEDGLKKKGDELSAAIDHNEIPPPVEMLTAVPIPNVKNINSLPSTVQQRDGETYGDPLKLNGLNLSDFPVPINVTACGVESNFGYAMAYFNTASIEPSLRPYILLFFELIMESPIRQDDGTLIPYENVVAAIESDTVSLQTSIGLEQSNQFSCGSYSQTAVLMIKTDHKKYIQGIQWVIDLLNRTEFTIDRVRVCAAKIANAVAQAKRNGSAVSKDLLKAVYYQFDSNVRKCSMIHQQRFLSSLLERLDKANEAKQIIAHLNTIRKEISAPNRLGLYIAADWNKVITDNPNEFNACWKGLVKSDDTMKFNRETIVCPQIDYHLRKKMISEGQTLGLGCVEGAFFCHAVPCKISHTDPEYVPMMLFMQYLTQLEGPFWKQLRGQGLTYGYNMYINLNEQLLYFTLYRATNVVAAFKQFKTITKAQLSEDAAWDPALLESARSSLIFEFVEREKSIDAVVLQNFILTCFKGAKRITDLNQSNICQVNKVTIDEMCSVGKKYISQLFTPNSRTTIVCNPEKAKEISEDFATYGSRMSISTNIDTSILSQED